MGKEPDRHHWIPFFSWEFPGGSSAVLEGMALWWGQDPAQRCYGAGTDPTKGFAQRAMRHLTTTICRQQATEPERLDLFFRCSGSCWLQQQLVEAGVSCPAGTQKALQFPSWCGYAGVMEALLCNSLKTLQKWLCCGNLTVVWFKKKKKSSPESWLFVTVVSCL